MKNNKPLIFLVIVIVGIFAILVLNASKQSRVASNQSLPQSPQPIESDSPKILSTKPEPLEDSVISANETIEITFNKSLENEGEFKLRIEPKAEFKLQLTQDRKTAKIIPLKPYELGATYTLFIGPNTKFEGIGEWKQEKIFHIRTIRYRGV